MKLAAPKRKLVKTVNQYNKQIVAAPKRYSKADSTVPCGAIITANEVIKYDTAQQNEELMMQVQKTVPSFQDHTSERERDVQPVGTKQEDQIRELTLLSMGKQLLDSCKEGDAAEVRRMMKEGAPFIADWVGTSPLHYSVMNKHVEVTELLLKHGISKETKNKVNRTPLHVAAHMGLAYMVKLLLTYGADVNCTDMLHMTPLHWAAESGDLLTAKILIDYGADIGIVNKFGKTACAIARANKHMEIVRTILDTELLPLSTRALKVSDMRSKVVTTNRDMKPVAEILEPSATEMKTSVTQETKKKKKVVVITTDNNLEGPMGSIRFGNAIGPPVERSESPEKMSADSAIKLLQSHGVSVMEPDKDTVVSSAVLNGHMIRLTEAGKLAFKSLEENVRLDKLPSPTTQSDDENGATEAKRTKHAGSSAKRESSSDEDNKPSDVAIEPKTSDIIIGSSLSECTIDLPSTTSYIPNAYIPNMRLLNANDRTKLYLKRLKDKQKEVSRHLEIIENQRTIKQNELTQLNQQIRILENVSNIKK